MNIVLTALDILLIWVIIGAILFSCFLFGYAVGIQRLEKEENQ